MKGENLSNSLEIYTKNSEQLEGFLNNKTEAIKNVVSAGLKKFDIKKVFELTIKEV